MQSAERTEERRGGELHFEEGHSGPGDTSLDIGRAVAAVEVVVGGYRDGSAGGVMVGGYGDGSTGGREEGCGMAHD